MSSLTTILRGNIRQYGMIIALAAIVIQVVGYAVAGLVIALILGWRRKAAPAA